MNRYPEEEEEEEEEDEGGLNADEIGEKNRHTAWCDGPVQV